jgi:hypothetical protein
VNLPSTMTRRERIGEAGVWMIVAALLWCVLKVVLSLRGQSANIGWLPLVALASGTLLVLICGPVRTVRNFIELIRAAFEQHTRRGRESSFVVDASLLAQWRSRLTAALELQPGVSWFTILDEIVIFESRADEAVKKAAAEALDLHPGAGWAEIRQRIEWIQKQGMPGRRGFPGV